MGDLTYDDSCLTGSSTCQHKRGVFIRGDGVSLFLGEWILYNVAGCTLNRVTLAGNK